jgi:hypothetical protein
LFKSLVCLFFLVLDDGSSRLIHLLLAGGGGGFFFGLGGLGVKGLVVELSSSRTKQANIFDQ